MQTVRVTCPECEFTFSIADSRVGGLISCRDCKAEFRVEFAEDDDAPAPASAPPAASTRENPGEQSPTPRSRPAPPRTRSRVDPDNEPEGWKNDLPIRSPVPLLFVLIGLQVLVAGFLVLNFFLPAGNTASQPTVSYYTNYPTAPKSVSTPMRR